MPGRTTRTTGGRIITKDCQAATATATTTQGASLGHLLGKVLGIAIGTAIEIKIEMKAVAGSKIITGTAPAVRQAPARSVQQRKQKKRYKLDGLTFCKL